MNSATTWNGTTANVTIPACKGIVGGSCLDPNTYTMSIIFTAISEMIKLQSQSKCIKCTVI
jgi:hypothetical protein